MTRVDVQQFDGNTAGPKCLGREVQHHHGVLATAEEDDGLARRRHGLAEDVDALGLKGAECVDARGVDAGAVAVVDARRVDARRGGRGLGRHAMIPHSVLSVPAQRPERASSPAATLRVHGSHPMLG